MAIALGEYDFEAFNALPLGGQAFSYVDRNPMADDAANDLRASFLQHNVTDDFGLYILHRHFDMDHEERLVEYRSVATPWRMDGAISIIDGEIRPKTWSLAQDVVRPLEFSYLDDVNDIATTRLPSIEFLADLRQVLKRHGLESIYGLSALPEDALDESKPSKLEFTTGRSNITVPMTTQISENLVAQTMFLFPCIDPLLDPEYVGPRMRHCIQCYRHREPDD